MNKAGHTALVAAVAISAVSGTAAAEPTARVEYSDPFTTRMPGAPSGRVFHDEFFDARDASAKPPPAQHIHVHLPHGRRFDTRAPALGPAPPVGFYAGGAAPRPPGTQEGSQALPFD